MKDFKVGDRVVCKNKAMVGEYAGIVGEVTQVSPACLMDTKIAIVKYGALCQKVPTDDLELYAPSHDYDVISISRKQFRDVVSNRLGLLGGVIHGNVIDDIEMELFGDTGDDD